MGSFYGNGGGSGGSGISTAALNKLIQNSLNAVFNQIVFATSKPEKGDIWFVLESEDEEIIYIVGGDSTDDDSDLIIIYDGGDSGEPDGDVIIYDGGSSEP